MTNTPYDLWNVGGELDDIAYRLEISTRLVLIMHTAFIDGQNQPDKRDFEALYSVFLQLDDIVKEVRNMGNTLQKIRSTAADHDGAADVLRALKAAYTAGHEGKPPLHATTPESFTTPEAVQTFRDAATAMYQYGKERAEYEAAG